MDLPELAGKEIQLLREAIPALARLAVLWDERQGDAQPRAAQGAAKTTGTSLVPIAIRADADLDKAVSRAMRSRPQALLVLSGPVIYVHRTRIVESAIRNRLPSASVQPELAEAGGLLGYGPNEALRRRALHPRQAHVEASREAERAPVGTEIDLGVDRVIGRQRDRHVARGELHRRLEARGPAGREELLRVGAGAPAARARQLDLEAAVGAARLGQARLSSARTPTAGRSRDYGVARDAAAGCCSSAEAFCRTFAAWSLVS